jgi:hypothetical protein
MEKRKTKAAAAKVSDGDAAKGGDSDKEKSAPKKRRRPKKIDATVERAAPAAKRTKADAVTKMVDTD